MPINDLEVLKGYCEANSDIWVVENYTRLYSGTELDSRLQENDGIIFGENHSLENHGIAELEALALTDTDVLLTEAFGYNWDTDVVNKFNELTTIKDFEDKHGIVLEGVHPEDKEESFLDKPTDESLRLVEYMNQEATENYIHDDSIIEDMHWYWAVANTKKKYGESTESPFKLLEGVAEMKDNGEDIMVKGCDVENMQSSTELWRDKTMAQSFNYAINSGLKPLQVVGAGHAIRPRFNQYLDSENDYQIIILPEIF